MATDAAADGMDGVTLAAALDSSPSGPNATLFKPVF